MPILHEGATTATQMSRDALAGAVPPGWFVDAQEPITTDTSEPEPDVTVVRGSRRQYLDRHPGPGDLALVVEVADTTLGRDRGSKKRLYARTRIPIYWIVNLLDKQVEVYTDPRNSPIIVRAGITDSPTRCPWSSTRGRPAASR